MKGKEQTVVIPSLRNELPPSIIRADKLSLKRVDAYLAVVMVYLYASPVEENSLVKGTVFLLSDENER